MACISFNLLNQILDKFWITTKTELDTKGPHVNESLYSRSKMIFTAISQISFEKLS